MEKLLKVSDGVDKVVTVLAFVFILGFLVVMFSQVILRNLAPQFAFTWSDGVCRYFFIWASFMAAARAVKHRKHIAITLLPDALKGNAKIINKLVIAAIFAVLLVITFRVGLHGIAVTSVQKSDTLPISAAWIYASIPVGAICGLFQLVVTSIEDIVRPSLPPSLEQEVLEQL